MAKSGDVYIQCTGNHGIKARTADNKLERRFDIVGYDAMSGRQTRTGYTKLTAEEYDKLCKESKLFKHFLDLGVLVKHDTPPADALMPSEALAAARREIAELVRRSAQLEKEGEALRKELEAERRKSSDLERLLEGSGAAGGDGEGEGEGEGEGDGDGGGGVQF